ncbi:MAG TPA: LamG-like jellyroll fold domain-containing protein [Thermoanaerobaculia bacterium]|nr:LamG-like jellyroll fold domain-containing protein [Thermoanaerobaculia bacterium]
MFRLRALAALFALGVAFSSLGATSPCLPATTTANEINRVVHQEFPAQGPTETAWTVVWSENGTQSLWIENAWFTPKPGAAPRLVLGRSGLSNIFVPYHEGTFRPNDLNPWTVTREAVPSYTGPCGTISGPALPYPTLAEPAHSSPPRQMLIKEIRERGVAWTSDGRTRRGEELLLWSVIDTGNYEYVVQYGFRDDGTITFRLGATGYNNPGMPFEPHMHDALWYVDLNVGHAAHNSVSLMRHQEPATVSSSTVSPFLQAADEMVPFNNGLEGFAEWKAAEFTGLNIRDTTATNAHGHDISYDLMPMRTGIARHDEDFTKFDFWVTRENAEYDYTSGFSNIGGVSAYLNPPQPITDTDVVVWCMTSGHHHPRDEDHEFDAQGNQKQGIAQTMWSGFDMHPRNFLDDAPLYHCLPMPTPIAGWWPFEEAAGATQVADIKNVGAPNTGTSHPQALGSGGPMPVAGATGGALGFTPSTFVEVNDDPSLNFGTGDFSLDTWIKAQPTGGTTNRMIDKRQSVGGSFRGWQLYLFNASAGLQLANGTTFANTTSTAVVADGHWHHVIVTIDRTSTTKEMRWYVDGNLTDTFPNPLAGSLSNTAPLRFGQFNGSLGEVELFPRVLTASEVRDVYAVGKCR